MNKKISIVTPTFNEEENISKLCNEISREMQNFSYDYEHIIIDNSSTDKTISIINKLEKPSTNVINDMKQSTI